MLPLVLFARLGDLACRPLALFFDGRAWVAAEFLPIFLCHVDALIFGCLPDIGEGEVADLVRDVESLVETHRAALSQRFRQRA
jgi:hypothetical protein